jgi:hypothetical protein
MRFGYNYGFYAMSPGNKTEPHSDPLLSFLTHYGDNYFTGRMKTSQLYGNTPVASAESQSKRFRMTSFYLEDKPYKWQDDHYRRSLFHELVMKNPDGSDPHYSRDHNVRHFSVNGEVATRTSSQHYGFVVDWRSYPHYGVTIEVPKTYGRFNEGVVTTPYWITSTWWRFVPNTQTPWAPNYIDGGSLWAPHTDGHKVLTWLLSQSEVTVTYRWNLFEWMDMKLRLKSYIPNPLGFDLEYSFDQSQYWTSGGFTQVNRSWEVKAGAWLVPTGESFPITTDWRFPPFRVHSYYNYELKEGWGVSLGSSSSGFTDTPFSGSANIPSEPDSVAPLAAPTATLDKTLNQSIQDVRTVGDTFGNFWDGEIVELRRSAVYSYHRAIESSLLASKTNYGEVLNELGGLPELIPDVKGLITILRSVKWRSLLSGAVALGNLLKLYASTNLQYNFGIAPTVGVVQELNALGPSIARRLIACQKIKREELKGQFIFSLPYGPTGYGDCRLITRTSCTIEQPADPFWFAIMKLYSVRIGVSTKNIWELIPMSFAVDWFTNMSGRFGSLDMSFLSIFIRASAIQHSYTVESTFDLTSKSRIATPFESLDPNFGYLRPKYFRRELSQTVPILSDGKIDYLAAAGNPDLGIFTSLVAMFTVP